MCDYRSIQLLGNLFSKPQYFDFIDILVNKGFDQKYWLVI
jgi:hypothetical protein